MMAIRNAEDVARNRMCHGCGACAYVCPQQAITLWDVLDEGIRPLVSGTRCRNCGTCLDVCSGARIEHDPASRPVGFLREAARDWGPVLELWEGHASGEEMWYRGSSGGVASALGAYCLEQEEMHGVLHVAMDPTSPHLSQAVLSRTRAELAERAGSRYAPAAVCAELGGIESAPAPMMLIGKPCDVAAAQMAAAIRPTLATKLGLTVAVFCGGTPSTGGTVELLQRLGTTQDQIRSLRYRGCGWPGAVTAEVKDGGDDRQMTYQEAWDTILTKRRPLRCRMCPDGTGEFADIACGDPWYRPVQDGEKGTSLILVRTQRGREILRRAVQTGYVVAEPRSLEVLAPSQQGLLNRRRHVWPKLLAFRLLGLPVPRFHGFSLWRGWLRLGTRRKFVSLYRAMREAIGLRRRGPVRHSGGQVREALPVHRCHTPADPPATACQAPRSAKADA